MASVAIVGPGAVGGTIAAWLKHAGAEVVLCARRTLGELSVEAPGVVHRFRPEVLTDPAQAGVADWVLVATKTYDAAGAALWFPGLVGPRTRVAILQNGVEHRERFAAFVPGGQLLPVMVDIPCERGGDPGTIRQRANGRMAVPDDASGRAFVALFAGTPIDVAVTADFRSVAWRKLCLNAAGVLNALLLQPARIFQDGTIAGLARDIVRECVTVGRAEGAVLDDGLPESVVATYRGAAPDSVNSLHADRAAGRPMEVDARNGVIVRLGRRHGIPTPCNQMAVALLQAMAAPR